MNSFTKTFIIAAIALALGLIASLSAHAMGPYDGYNRIGTYYQYSRTVPVYSYPAYSGYGYVAPARAGGFFGSGTEYLVGLRSPVYTQIPPVHYTNYYQATCGWPCYFNGGNGYPRQTASSAYRSRMGGFGYY